MLERYYLLSAILVYQIWIILSKSILISILISNTSYSMKYEINIDTDSIIHKEYCSQQKYKSMIQLFLFLDLVLCALYALEFVLLLSSVLIFTRSARIGETSIHSWLFIKILVIDLDWTNWNESGRLTVLRLGISIHDSIIQYQTRKSYWTRMTETISRFMGSDWC